MLSTQSMKVILMSTERDSLMELRADIILGRHSSSMAVVIHLLISSCMKSEVVMDFFMIVKMIFSEKGYIRLCSLLIISLRHIKASLVTPDLRLLKFWRSSLTMRGIIY
jgi:hypothetical protein